MFRWFGNQLRTNPRIIELGPNRMPFFVWWSAVDQRLSMWTTLAGPIFAVIVGLQSGPVPALYYIAWVGFTRWILSLVLLASRPRISWLYPFLLYYSQVYGAIIKTYALFRLDQQSWTRQKTGLNRDLSFWKAAWIKYSSTFVHAVAFIIFCAAIGWFTSALSLPETTFCQIFGCTNRTFL
jgi:glycosyltransferase Alg8